MKKIFYFFLFNIIVTSSLFFTKPGNAILATYLEYRLESETGMEYSVHKMESTPGHLFLEIINLENPDVFIELSGRYKLTEEELIIVTFNGAYFSEKTYNY